MQSLHPKSVWLLMFNYTFVILIILYAAIGASFTFMSYIFPQIYSYSGGINYEINITIYWFGFLFLIILPASFVWAYLSYQNYKYQFTNDSLKIEKGVIIKKYLTIPYARIQNIDIYRGVLARLLKLSDLQIQTAGYSGSSQYGSLSEGRLPGLDILTAEQLREELTKKLKGSTTVSNPAPVSGV